MESIADFRRYLWYVNFGDPGSLNDLNVLDKSSIVGAMLSGKLDMKTNEYEINGTLRDWNYFQVDGISPKWAIFVNPYQDTSDPQKEQIFFISRNCTKGHRMCVWNTSTAVSNSPKTIERMVFGRHKETCTMLYKFLYDPTLWKFYESWLFRRNHPAFMFNEASISVY